MELVIKTPLALVVTGPSEIPLDGNDDSNNKVRKLAGLPEIDPDALPSASVNKYL